MQESQNTRIIANGKVPITKQNINPPFQKLPNYQALIANMNDIFMCASVILKITTRYTEENSLISVMALCYVVVDVHHDLDTFQVSKFDVNDAKQTSD